MGAGLSSYVSPMGLVNLVSGRKRKISDSDPQEDLEKIIEIAMQTPKRKKLESTAAYIYKALFIEGNDSDVTVVALNTVFKLHKVYLCQSPYFASMFGGNWKETSENKIFIDVVDPLITKEAFHTVLGALYHDEVKLEPLSIVSVLAGATMLQLGGLIERCSEVMLETINPHSAVMYYEAACQYGDVKLKSSCVKWFLVNLMFYYSNNINDLKTIPIGLMEHLVGHPDLCVMKTEINLYSLLSQWTYLQIYSEDENVTSKDISLFYSNRTGELPFLQTSEGSKFLQIFHLLRMQHLITHNSDIDLILRDNILPRTWLDKTIFQGWKYALKINQNEVKGPVNESTEEFLKNSLRCGRTITKGKHVWRWTGFHYGVDLIMIADNSELSVKRNHRPDFEQLLSFQETRNVMIRVTAYAVNDQKQVILSVNSEVRSLTLGKGDEEHLMYLPSQFYPLILSVNILYTSSLNDNVTEEAIQSI